MARDTKQTVMSLPPILHVNLNEIDLDKLRKIVKSHIDKQQYNSALFWADKVTSLSKDALSDVYTYGQCLFLTGQYHRGALYLQRKKLHMEDRACQYLTAKCQFACKEYVAALKTLDIVPKDFTTLSDNQEYEDRSLESSILLLKGQIFEVMENRELAIGCFTKALQYDIYCYEAFNALVQHQMMTRDEENALMKHLPFSSQCEVEEANLVRLLYGLQLKKYNGPEELPQLQEANMEPLIENLDVQTALAERLYYNCDYHGCYRFTQAILDHDAYHTQCLPIHISCLMELKKTNQIFSLAHKLVERYPEGVIAWYAVGCYYLLINKRDSARRYLSKATSLDKVFGPAWLMYGHSFAVENEHDQAMSAYFKASLLMKGCHLPLLYIGLEYGLNNNPKLAEKFLLQALNLAPKDPFVLHEIGVVSFHSGDYLGARRLFLQALEHVSTTCPGYSQLPEKWEPLLNNLGHTERKLKNYEKALEYHKLSLVLSPLNPATLSAIGYVYTLQKQWSKAVDMFHKALGIQKDDAFSTTMLCHAIENLIAVENPCNKDGNMDWLDTQELSQTSSLLRPPPTEGDDMDMELTNTM